MRPPYFPEGREPPIPDLSGSGPELCRAERRALRCVDQHQCWRRGERILVEDFLLECPDLVEDEEGLLDLLFSEIILREQYGDEPTLDEYLRRFGKYETQLRQWFALHDEEQPDDSPSPPTCLYSVTEAPSHGPAELTPPEPLQTFISPTPRHTLGRRRRDDDDQSWPVVPGYEILGELGSGGMGVVYRARQNGLKRLVALKMVGPWETTGAEDLLRFRNEAEAVARLHHPHIVQIYQVGDSISGPFFSMELVEGEPLSRRLSGRPQPAREAARLTALLASAIHYAHENGIIHRDLKPANVLLNRDGEPKITDFGLSKQLDSDSTRTRDGVVLGTPSYMSPEQAAGGRKPVGPVSDVYSLGAVLYEMLTGKPPFQGETAWETVRQVTADEPVSPRRLQPRVPADLETICLKCLNKEPGRRYASAADLAADLNRFLEGRPTVARPASVMERLWKWSRRRPTAAALVGLGAITALLLLTGGFLYGQYQRERAEFLRQRLADQQHERELREEALGLYEKGQEAAAAHDWQTALRHLERMRGVIDSEPELADLSDRAAHALTDVRARLDAQSGRLRAREKYERFLRWRDDALFHAMSFPGQDGVADLRACRGAVDRALTEFDWTAEGASTLVLDPTIFSPSEQAEVREGCYELLLVLAEIIDRDNGTPPARRAERALQVLDRAEGLNIETRTYHLRRARYLTRLGDNTSAAEERRRSEAIRPGTAVDFFLAGQEGLQRGDPATAARDLESALRLQPDHFWARYFLAVACLKAHRPAEAKVCLTACLGRRRDFVWLYLHRGFACAEMGEFATAEEDYQTALSMKPDDLARYAALVSRAVLRARQDQNDKAMTDLQEAVRLRPEEPAAYVNLARIYQKQGRLPGALGMLDRAIALRQDDASLYRSRARLHGICHEDEAALADLSVAMQLDAPAAEEGSPAKTLLAEDHLERGRVLFRMNRHAEALTACESALALRHDYPMAERLRAETLVELQKFEDALHALDRYLANLARPDPVALRTRGIVRAQLGNHAGALDDFGKSLELQPDCATYVARGWAYLLVHEAPRLALPDFEEAARLDPTSGEARVGRGLARVKLGHWGMAITDAEDAVRLGPSSSRLLYNSARLFAQAAEQVDAPGNPAKARELRRQYQERAVQLLRQAVEAQPLAHRMAFWNKVALADSAWQPLRQTSGFTRLAAEYAQATPTRRPTE
jgi:tetratricopeptide (TPR) repeat protein